MIIKVENNDNAPARDQVQAHQDPIIEDNQEQIEDLSNEQDHEDRDVQRQSEKSSPVGSDYSEYSFNKSDFEEGNLNERNESRLTLHALTNMGRNLFNRQ